MLAAVVVVGAAAAAAAVYGCRCCRRYLARASAEPVAWWAALGLALLVTSVFVNAYDFTVRCWLKRSGCSFCVFARAQFLRLHVRACLCDCPRCAYSGRRRGNMLLLLLYLL